MARLATCVGGDRSIQWFPSEQLAPKFITTNESLVRQDWKESPGIGSSPVRRWMGCLAAILDERIAHGLS
ncbi:hypothetical protein RBSH_04406 [Rhodopirellula baltica SH28]|uniref:Uncharacterized protein n=1 Tax=Rhodopirellula baltica SH28 TaxID=993517 RepID=K5E3C2_RHOBT|nr:hypothetical protein RBSH_04406 [Rhodopirellula baltica SH28]